MGLNLLPSVGRDLILAGAIISIVLNPLVFYLCDLMKPALEARLGRPTRLGRLRRIRRSLRRAVPAGAAALFRRSPARQRPARAGSADGATDEENGTTAKQSTLTGHTVLVGFGRVGRIVGRELKSAGQPFLVIEAGDKRIAEAKAAGIEVISGNAANEAVLRLANLAAATTLLIAIPDAFEAGQIAEQARRANRGLSVIARAHADAEAEHLTRHGADTVIVGEHEIARAMIETMNQPIARRSARA